MPQLPWPVYAMLLAPLALILIAAIVKTWQAREARGWPQTMGKVVTSGSEVREVKVGHRGGPVDPRGVDDDVELPEAVLHGVEQGGYRLLVGDVRREGRAAPALLSYLLDRHVGQVDAAGVRHGDIEPVGGQLGRDGPAHAAGPAGYQGSPRPVSRRIFCSHEPTVAL